MPATESEASDVPAVRTPGFALVAVLLASAFCVVEHDVSVSRKETYARSADEMMVSVASGSSARQLAFCAVGALGLALLVRRSGHPLRFGDPLAATVVLYLAWCAASVRWSDTPLLTGKRLVVLGFCFLGALGMARQFSANQFRRLVVAVLTGYCALGLAVELALGTFRPWSGDYRFAGTVHPNTQGLYCAALALALAVRAGWSTPDRRRHLALLGLAVALLALTKSRSAYTGLAVALSLVTLLRIPARQHLLVWGATTCIASAALVTWIILGPQISEAGATLVTLGRQEEVGTLSGRIPLWIELTEYIRRRPLVGYGYDSFWSPERIEAISAELGWAIQSAHSGYLETVLGVGLVGGFLLGIAMAGGIVRLGRQVLATRDAGSAFLLGLLVLGAICSVMESGLTQPMLFLPFIGLCGLIRAALCAAEGHVA